MKETSKNVVTKRQVESALGLEDKNREKLKKLPKFDLNYSIGKFTSTMMDHKTSQYFNQFLSMFKL